ncbi:GNAT family N-acetyltransferase [Candidatus Clostridium radicumherbarum]|uniref:GNAT family N-acetyltransferase n=1 Tax=Candidatus Clostridium radicumherbarum TaxID=3381662 RepID=A0ABW8TSX0_9CLOT
MIRKLDQRDNNNLMELIMDEPEYNLYIIGDVENFGYCQDFLELFGEFDEYGVISAVLVRYFGIFNLYAKDRFDVDGFVNIMKSYDKLGMLVGKTQIISRFEDTSLGFNKSELHHFAVLKELKPQFEIDKNVIVKKANTEYVGRIADLKNMISEFSSGSNNFKEILINDFKAGTAQGYYIEVDGNMVSYAQTSAENSKSAMIVSVMTDKKYRKKGLASACLKVLCDDLVKQGKTLCLFYRNPEAGAIYRRLGFKEIGLWSMYMKTEK